MARRDKQPPTLAEASTLRIICNGHGPIKVTSGTATLAGMVVAPSVFDSLYHHNWIVWHHDEGRTECYVGTKRGREALELAPAPELKPLPVVTRDERFGVVARVTIPMVRVV